MPNSADERRAGLMQGAQRVTLPADLVLGQRQQRPPPLPQRGLGRPGLSLGEHLPMVPRTQSRLQADLLGVQAKLLKSASLDPTGVPALELAEGRPPPQRQRFTAHVRGTVVLAQGAAAPSRGAPAARSGAHPPDPAASSDGNPPATSRSPRRRAPCGAERQSPAPPCSTWEAQRRPTSRRPAARRSPPHRAAGPAPPARPGHAGASDEASPSTLNGPSTEMVTTAASVRALLRVNGVAAVPCRSTIPLHPLAGPGRRAGVRRFAIPGACAMAWMVTEAGCSTPSTEAPRAVR